MIHIERTGLGPTHYRTVVMLTPLGWVLVTMISVLVAWVTR